MCRLVDGWCALFCVLAPMLLSCTLYALFVRACVSCMQFKVPAQTSAIITNGEQQQ